MRTYAPLATLLLVGSISASAQQGAAVFHHFHHYPVGQYTTQLQGATNGVPSGAPITQTACSGTPTPAQISAAAGMANSAAAMQSCTIKVIRDEEKVAEYEQTCARGPAVQVTHTTLTAVDDKLFQTDLLSKIGSHSITTHSSSHYDGPCTAAQLAETSRPIPKPTAEECAELQASKQEMAAAAGSCEQVPAAYRDTCNKNIQAASANVNRMIAACAK